MNVLGIDPGLSATGLGLISFDSENGNLRVKRWTVIYGKDGSLAERILHFYTEIESFITHEDTDIAVVEKIFYGMNTKTLIHLGELRGAIILLLMKSGIPIVEYSPREVKRALTGSGASSKKQVCYMVKQILRIEEELPLDASDALASALCYIQRNYG